VSMVDVYTFIIVRGWVGGKGQWLVDSMCKKQRVYYLLRATDLELESFL